MQTKILKHYCSRALLGSIPVRTKNTTLVTNMYEFEFNYSQRLLSIKNVATKETLNLYIHLQRFILRILIVSHAHITLGTPLFLS